MWFHRLSSGSCLAELSASGDPAPGTQHASLAPANDARDTPSHCGRHLRMGRRATSSKPHPTVLKVGYTVKTAQQTELHLHQAAPVSPVLLVANSQNKRSDCLSVNTEGGWMPQFTEDHAVEGAAHKNTKHLEDGLPQLKVHKKVEGPPLKKKTGLKLIQSLVGKTITRHIFVHTLVVKK